MIKQELNTIPVPNYEYITNVDDIGRVLEDISHYPEIEVDTETTGLDPYQSKISLVQIGIPNKAYVFDIRSDLDHVSVDIENLKPILSNKGTLKVLQNAVFDMKMIKVHGGYYLENIYDTMLVEQLFNLGLTERGASLADIVLKYLGLHMTKEPQGTFKKYEQKFEKYQLDYAAADVSVLCLIRDLQLPRIKKEGFENVCRLEFEFTKAMCEMELNGITIDKDKWRIIMGETDEERLERLDKINEMLIETSSKPSLFGVPSINVDSNKQLLNSLKDHGLDLPNTNEGTLKKYKDVPIIKELLGYRKQNKLISTYGEPLLKKINPVTGRLHTRFRQMVSTGRLSSSSPNLQNIPHDQKFRSCFIAKPGYKLITADQASAELNIIGNLSEDPVFIHCFKNGIDLHSKSASEVFKVPIEKVDKTMRNSCKAISFGLVYGMSKYGLAKRLSISEEKAEKLINSYFNVFDHVKKFLDESSRLGVKNGYSLSVAGRKRFYNIPPFGHPDRKKIQKSVERQAKNMPIQSTAAEITKESIVYIVKELEKRELDSKILLTVHDEVVLETKDDKYLIKEVSEIIRDSVREGAAKYFTKIPMSADALVGPCWIKDSCGKCGCEEMVFEEDPVYKTKLVCSKCGDVQG